MHFDSKKWCIGKIDDLLFGLGFKGKIKKFYNLLKLLFYIAIHKEQDKGHKLHDIILHSYLYYLDLIIT
jgi:hypothetical protein